MTTTDTTSTGTSTGLSAGFEDIAAAIIGHLLADLTQTDDIEKRNEAAFQLGALKNRCEHDSKPKPNPSWGEQVLQAHSQALATIVDTVIASADPDHFAHIIDGITWSIHNQT